MIKNYNQYINEHLEDIDPYGEEEWEELTPVLHLARQQNPGKNWNQITKLNCYRNQLTSLEGIEKLTNLKILNCFNNRLTNLNLENLTNLTILYCSSNQLTSLEAQIRRNF